MITTRGSPLRGFLMIGHDFLSRGSIRRFVANRVTGVREEQGQRYGTPDWRFAPAWTVTGIRTRGNSSRHAKDATPRRDGKPAERISIMQKHGSLSGGSTPRSPVFGVIRR